MFNSTFYTTLKKKPKVRLFVMTAAVFLVLFYFAIIESSLDTGWFKKSHHFLGKRQTIIYDDVFKIKNGSKKILLWTNYFGSTGWLKSIRQVLDKCNCSCHVTLNKNEIETADAVIFHLLDLFIWTKPPIFRAPHQVWILYNMEPTIFLHNIGINLSSWKHMFNWTMSYRTDSTIYSPYGRYVELSDTEKEVQAEVLKSRDLSREKYKFAFAMVGDCYDDSGRLKILFNLQNHISLDIYGRCGNLSCSQKNYKACNAKLKPYIFKAAFENGNCRDYVTEKYWDALHLENIPIVNWKEGQVIPHVPPHSYINIYDFRNIEELSLYLKQVSTNKTLFNSYHEWRSKYRTQSDMWLSYCKLCEKLHEDKRQSHVILDPFSWIKDETCDKWSVSNMLRRHFNFWVLHLQRKYKMI